MLSTATQDYLKAIYELEADGHSATTSALADRLRVTPASVSGMVRRLADDGLIEHARYRGARLTDLGRKAALLVVRQHRLVELFLSRQLELPWDRVHDEAERWEHVLSRDVEERMDAVLGHPRFDPHGAPIPRRDGTMDVPERSPILDLETGEPAVIAEVSDHDPELLRYIGSLGLYPGTPFELVEVAPFNGPLTLRVDEELRILGREAARHVLVTPMSRSDKSQNR